MDSVIFTLYNYASNQREEYLLAKLFKTALQEEIKWEPDTETQPTIPYDHSFKWFVNTQLNVLPTVRRSKVDQMKEIVTGNPTVIKMVVSFHRGARGQNALRQILAPVVKEIMDDKSLNIKTDPVDIYKSWVNQMETQTGEARWAGEELSCDCRMTVLPNKWIKNRLNPIFFSSIIKCYLHKIIKVVLK